MAAMGSERYVDYTKSEFWAQQWATFQNDFWVMLPLFVGVVVAVWWLRGWMSKREIGGLKGEISVLEQRLKAQISVMEERLKFAAEQMAASDRVTDELEKQFQLYKEKVAIEGSKASPAKVDAAIVGVAKSNTEIRSKLVNALMKRETDRGTPVIKIDGDPKIR
jgi:hypothetical protein